MSCSAAMDSSSPSSRATYGIGYFAWRTRARGTKPTTTTVSVDGACDSPRRREPSRPPQAAAARSPSPTNSPKPSGRKASWNAADRVLVRRSGMGAGARPPEECFRRPDPRTEAAPRAPRHSTQSSPSADASSCSGPTAATRRGRSPRPGRARSSGTTARPRTTSSASLAWSQCRPRQAATWSRSVGRSPRSGQPPRSRS